MIEELEKTLGQFSITIDAVKEKLVTIGRKKYVKSLLLPTQRPPIHYKHCYFAMASLVLKGVKNILEIGTSKFGSTVVFSKLFPEATVYTIDVKNRGKYRPDHDNIKFIESNSFFLPSLKLPEKFEIIFVDGDHVFPAVAWDISFAYACVAKGGFLFMHDYEVERLSDNDVKITVEYIRNRIPEDILLLSEYADPKLQNGRMACMRKVR